jgi:hypothetical protein
MSTKKVQQKQKIFREEVRAGEMEVKRGTGN